MQEEKEKQGNKIKWWGKVIIFLGLDGNQNHFANLFGGFFEEIYEYMCWEMI